MSARIGSIQDFYQWVKVQDPESRYDYYNRTDCAVAQYCKQRGVPYRNGPAGSVGPHLDLDLEEDAYWAFEFTKSRTAHCITFGALRACLEHKHGDVL